MANGLIVPLQVTVHQTHVVIFHGARRDGMKRLLHVTDGAFVIPEARLHLAQPVGGEVVRGIQIDRLLQGVQCRFIVF